MTFYRPDPRMNDYLKSLLEKLSSQNRPNLHNNIAITWIRYDNPNPLKGSGIGTSWSENQLFYPASIVKLIYAIATEVWLQNDIIIQSDELFRALKEMIANSSNDATSFIIDILTGTNSGPSLPEEKWEIWCLQRKLINKWLHSLNWAELQKINCSQKTWNESPYGREKDFYGKNNENRNALTTASTARIFEALMTNSLLSPVASKRLKTYLSRSLDPLKRIKDPENQIDGFLGEGLTETTKIWSKAGWMSEVRHDAAWWKAEDKNPMLAVVFAKNDQFSKDTFLLPQIAKALNEFNEV